MGADNACGELLMTLWTDERVEALREFMRDNGASHSTVAAQMSEKFHCAYSRNAVLGKAARLGIPSNNPPRSRHHLKSKATEPAVTVRRPRYPKPPPVTAEPAALRSVDVTPRHISLLELKSGECRWPYGDVAPFTYCGNPVLTGSYCGPHHYLSRRS